MKPVPKPRRSLALAAMQPKQNRMFASNPVRMSTKLAAADELYAYQNTLSDYGCTLPGSEYFTHFTISTFNPAGTVLVNQLMNPLLFPDTRLANIAKNYQEFRFKRARIVHVPTVSTSVDGALVMNYFENPEFELGVQTAKTMFATRGYKSPIRTRGSVDARLDSEWRTIDLSSHEYLKTCQGKFVVALDTPTTISGTLQFDMIIEYQIEFRGMSKQQISYGVPMLGASTTGTPTGANVVLTDALSPAPSGSPICVITPALNITTNNGGIMTAPFARVFDSTTVRFYASYDDFDLDIAIPVSSVPPFKLPFVTYTPVTSVN